MSSMTLINGGGSASHKNYMPNLDSIMVHIQLFVNRYGDVSMGLQVLGHGVCRYCEVYK